ncbi:MAG: hypothetical protein ACOYM1_12150, partial [Methylovulum sp.]
LALSSCRIHGSFTAPRTLDVARIVPGDFFEVDARQYPMTGLSLNTTKIRKSRLYFLNVVTEFATKLFNKAGIPFQAETFVATHCVDDGYIPLAPIAHLVRPLVVVNATKTPIATNTTDPLPQLRNLMNSKYHVSSSKKVHFEEISNIKFISDIPEYLDPTLNYLFLNGKGEKRGGSIKIANKDALDQYKSVKARDAYNALAAGNAVADAYTEHKYKHLMMLDTVSAVMQGLNYGPDHFAELEQGKKEDSQLREAIKRCLVEMSLKECLLGAKNIPISSLPKDIKLTSLTLLATRHISMPGRRPNKQLVSAVNIEITHEGICVSKVRRSPWATDTIAAFEFASEFEFLMDDPKKPIRNAQFWIVDRQTNQRLRVWSGAFVPKIILSDGYAGIEAALGDQQSHLIAQRAKVRPNGTRGQGKFYSKSREFNLLPYYMSMLKRECQSQGDHNGLRISVEDRNTFIRVFVPPEGGVTGTADSLSSLRDVMLYEADGTPVIGDLLKHELVQIYLHSMTNGILVGGDNSKMSILEKLA